MLTLHPFNVSERTCTDDFSPYLHQVAGCLRGIPFNILVNNTGQIFKPCKLPSAEVDQQDDELIPVTLDEVQFYTKVNCSTESDFISLRSLTPNFFGTTSIKDKNYLILEDFTQGMKYPCVMDIKIGMDRYYPGRLKEKSAQDIIKYPCLKEYGFCLSGIKLWNLETGEVHEHLMSKVTRQYSCEEVKRSMKQYLRLNEDSHDVTLSNKIIEGVGALVNWSMNQRSFILRGCSVLFIYDAASCRPSPLHHKREVSRDLRARVGMIDFAHTFHSYGTRDDNFYYGIKNLINFIKSCHL